MQASRLLRFADQTDAAGWILRGWSANRNLTSHGRPTPANFGFRVARPESRWATDTMPELRVMIQQPSIAHYKITSKLGEGGMGAVYRATDAKLNREVEIKILPDAFADDADRWFREILIWLIHWGLSLIRFFIPAST
jgi:serine/threonine protein kinase